MQRKLVKDKQRKLDKDKEVLREHGSRSRIVNITINRLRYWNKFQQLRLTQHMRVSDGNIEWCDFLLAVAHS